MHDIALQIEIVLKNILGFVDRGGLNGLVDADTIEREPVFVIMISYIYDKCKNGKEEEINLEFLNQCKLLCNKRLDEIVNGNDKILSIDVNVENKNIENLLNFK